MKKQFFSLYLIIIVLHTNIAFSQNFESGTIVKNGVSISGLIKYESWLYSPTKISFKSGINAIEEITTAEEITSFSVNGETYSSQNLTVQTYLDGPNDSYQMEGKFYETVRISGAFFLRNIFVSQSIKLLRMIDAQERTRFFLEKDGQVNELINFIKKIENNTGKYEQKMKGYIGQLQQSFSDCTVPVSDELLYQEKELIRICSVYVACKGEIVNFDKKGKSDKISVEPILNLGFFPYGSFLIWGTGLNISFPRNYGNKYVRAELNSLRFNGKPVTIFSVLAGSYFGSKL